MRGVLSSGVPRAAVVGHRAPVAREGAPLLGELPVSGIGAPAAFPRERSTEDILRGARAANKHLLARLRSDPNAQELWDLTDKDFRLWRMHAPEGLSDLDLGSVIMVPWFGVVQGVRSDGARKARARARPLHRLVFVVRARFAAGSRGGRLPHCRHQRRNASARAYAARDN